MNTAINQNITHESESQRQYARVKIPARVIFEHAGEKKRLMVVDLSAGGFAFNWTGSPLDVKGYKGHLEFNVGGFVLLMPIHFDVRSIDNDGRAGCSFQNMGQQEVSSLRHMITAFLAGEVVSAGDMINIVGRDNFSKARGKKSGTGLEGLAKAKALVGSLLFFAVGLLAFGYVVTRLYDVLAVGRSEIAVISQDLHLVNSPREGVIELLVKPGDKVEAGQIIGTFSSPLVSFLSDSLTAEQLSSESIQNAVSKSYVGSLVSPCDCSVASVHAAQKEYVSKGKKVVSLVQGDVTNYVLAEFKPDAAQYLFANQSVVVNAAGVDFTGKVDEFIPATADGVIGHTLVAKISLTNSDAILASGTPAIVKYSKFRIIDEL